MLWVASFSFFCRVLGANLSGFRAVHTAFLAHVADQLEPAFDRPIPRSLGRSRPPCGRHGWRLLLACLGVPHRAGPGLARPRSTVLEDAPEHPAGRPLSARSGPFLPQRRWCKLGLLACSWSAAAPVAKMVVMGPCIHFPGHFLHYLVRRYIISAMAHGGCFDDIIARALHSIGSVGSYILFFRIVYSHRLSTHCQS